MTERISTVDQSWDWFPELTVGGIRGPVGFRERVCLVYAISLIVWAHHQPCDLGISQQSRRDVCAIHWF